ncbi:conserved hypothetical protein [gamma proteobacterium HTCC5015]|nr:conserved hypothetical protein [gamma proteobacterium HTCC5015]
MPRKVLQSPCDDTALHRALYYTLASFLWLWRSFVPLIRYVIAMVLSLSVFSAAASDEAEPQHEGKVIYGLHEKVRIKELGVNLSAKLDTGAESASLSARFIKLFERDGEDWVEFDLSIDKNDRQEMGLSKEQWDDVQMPLSRHVRIKKRSENLEKGEKDYSRRPVVEMTVCIGGREAVIDVNLTDRRDFSYPLLIGSDALRKLNSLVDPAISMGSGRPQCKAENTDAPSEANDPDKAGD